MGAPFENFKGIEFVRISSLPDEQKEKIWKSFHQDKIFKIVKDKSLLNDCILSNDYVTWLEQQHSAAAKPVVKPEPQGAIFAKLAFK